MKVVSVSGFGESGSSAVTDYIRDLNAVQVFDEIELQILHKPDGILSLQSQLVFIQSRIACSTAISRFRRELKTHYSRLLNKKTNGKYSKVFFDYINELTQIKWKGFSTVESSDIIPVFNKKFLSFVSMKINAIFKRLNIKIHVPRFRDRFYSQYTEDEFIKITKKYFEKFMLEMDYDLNSDIVIDQLFSYSQPTMGAEFFDSSKTILVDRDPRDVYLNMRKGYWYDSFMPWSDVHDFIKYYKLIHSNVTNDSENILRISFEDLVLNFNHTSREINRFLDLDSTNHSFNNFNPKVSMNNVGLYKKNISAKYKEDIFIIQQELNEYLYKEIKK